MSSSPYLQPLEITHTVHGVTTVYKSKHVTIDCTLRIGMSVWFDDDWGYKLKGVQCVIEDIKRANSQSGFMVKVDKYDNYVDSDWLNSSLSTQGK